MGEDGVSYAGPQRADVPAGPVRVVLFGPQAEKMAQSAEMKAQLAAQERKGRAVETVACGERPELGRGIDATGARDCWDEHALAIVALDRNAAHLSEQLALKAFVPVVALSSDKDADIDQCAVDLPTAGRDHAGGGAAAAGSGRGAQRAQSGAAAGCAGLGKRCFRCGFFADGRAAREVGRTDFVRQLKGKEKGQPALRAALCGCAAYAEPGWVTGGSSGRRSRTCCRCHWRRRRGWSCRLAGPEVALEPAVLETVAQIALISLVEVWYQ